MNTQRHMTMKTQPKKLKAAAKAMLRRKFMALKAYDKKRIFKKDFYLGAWVAQ